MDRERHIFAGNNTADGFCSFFEYIINPAEAEHIYILKGGPGVGKNTFMRKIAKKAIEQGYFVEYIHCTDDEDNLDGVLIPQMKVVIVDGTSPHIMDPKYPGAVDEIINLGVYLNDEEIKKHKDEIISISQRSSTLYRSAYRFIKAAGSVLDENNGIYDSVTSDGKFTQLCEETIEKIFPETKTYGAKGRERKLFASAYTSNGYVDFSGTLGKNLKIWAVMSENLNYISKLMEKVSQEANRRGFDTECFYTPIQATRLEHVIIPELGIILKSGESRIIERYDEIVNLYKVMDLDKLEQNFEEIEDNKELFNILMKYAFEKLSHSNQDHNTLEKIYIDNMDFTAVDICFEQVISELLPPQD